MPLSIRHATAQDGSTLLSIYAPYVTNTAVSFEVQVPALPEFTKRIEAIANAYPFLVCECNGEIAGYAYAAAHRERAAYCFDVDVSVYVAQGAQGQGIGTALYERLFPLLVSQGYYTAYAAITLPNEASCLLHQKFGFRKIGVHQKTGHKFGQWHDVLWLDKPLKDYAIVPE